ncbi:MAG: ABC transporter substrate-binding protein [Patescibacteria group bacterium]
MSVSSRRFPTQFESFRRPAIFDRFFSHIKRLPPGDKLILSILFIAFIVCCLAGLRELEKTFLVEQPARGGVLIEGVIGSPRFVNPLLALTDADRDLTALTYAGLMGIGADGSLMPVLAERYEISEDGRTYTFVLREHVKFSDNTPVTAEDVVFTVERAQDPSLKSPEFANWASVRAEVVDSRTVRFTLPQPYAPFIEDTTLGILPARLWRNVPNSQFPFSPLMERPVGAGPFMVTQVIRDRNGNIKEYNLAAFKSYATGRPYLDRIHMKFYAAPSELASAVRRGAVESAYGVAREGALRAPYARVFGVFFNPEKETVLANDEVREALSVAIDRTNIVNNVLGGYGTPLMGPLPPGAGVPSPTLPDPAGRIEAARLILDEGGWDFEEGVGWSKGETPMPTITLRTSSVAELKLIAASVQSDWEALGVPVEVELYESGSLTQEVIRPRDYDALLFGEVIGRDRDLYAFWHSDQRKDPGLNIAVYANEDVDALLTRIRTEIDPAAVSADLARAGELIASDYPAAFTHAPDFLYAVPNDLKGIVLPQIASPSDRFATVASWHRYSEFVWPFLVSSK